MNQLHDNIISCYKFDFNFSISFKDLDVLPYL